MLNDAGIYEASDDIGSAGGMGFIGGIKRTEQALFCKKSLLSWRFRTQKPLYRHLSLRGKATIALVRITC
ncbi:hypothetical protein PRIO_2344 [Paenibacillus riograndensis SBR5]|uniref:Uncharacterized protein n=1 Tax=Paenibacillus riograndensis SBR5 TaxID=1073571 RepID=A0A0E3WH66_9BACL|nr:hypothetical protein PRIO_2344 [Paenibacillus riograndensis SBR5]